MASERRGKRRTRKRRPGWLLIGAIAALTAGFMARRMAIPEALHFLTHRPPPPVHYQPIPAGGGAGETR
ncbi:MAG: hypothetical protein ACREQI_12860 [Candidatus Binataceae bacterium]